MIQRNLNLKQEIDIKLQDRLLTLVFNSKYKAAVFKYAEFAGNKSLNKITKNSIVGKI